VEKKVRKNNVKKEVFKGICAEYVPQENNV
jgi:hypothetical protein